MISAGTLRRLAQPIFLRYWLKRTATRVVTTRVGGFSLRIYPTVFHPRFFGSSEILGEYIASLNLKRKTFLDMGTGSGIVGLFAARAGAIVTGVDINPQAVRCASENAASAGLEIEYLQSDLFSGLEARRFDVIAWNPPFFARPANNAAEAALFAGDNHAVIARFARESRARLNPEGVLYIVLSMDVDVQALAKMFELEGFAANQVMARKWGLRETMVVLEIR